jgi:hypothetical protein
MSVIYSCVVDYSSCKLMYGVASNVLQTDVLEEKLM